MQCSAKLHPDPSQVNTVLCCVWLVTVCSVQPFDTSINTNTIDNHLEGKWRQSVVNSSFQIKYDLLTTSDVLLVYTQNVGLLYKFDDQAESNFRTF